MTPADFQPAGHWHQRTRGPTRDDRRPIWKLTHPDDPAFHATLTTDGRLWKWSVNGRIGMHNYGYDKRKRPAMHAAIQSLKETHQRCQNPFLQ